MLKFNKNWKSTFKWCVKLNFLKKKFFVKRYNLLFQLFLWTAWRNKEPDVETPPQKKNPYVTKLYHELQLILFGVHSFWNFSNKVLSNFCYYFQNWECWFFPGSDKLKMVIIHLCHGNVKTIRGFINILLACFFIDKTAP